MYNLQKLQHFCHRDYSDTFQTVQFKSEPVPLRVIRLALFHRDCNIQLRDVTQQVFLAIQQILALTDRKPVNFHTGIGRQALLGGTYSLVITAVVLAILIAANVFAAVLPPAAAK